MSKELKHSVFAFLGAVTALAVAALLPLLADPAPSAPREIVLVARNMTFYLDGDPTPNPTIRIRANGPVRIVLRNEDAGMTHNLVIDAWGVTTAALRGVGETSLELRAPARAGRLDYYCGPHARTMRGVVEIE